MRQRRGFTLILTLGLATLFLVMGMGFLSHRASQGQAANAHLQALQARALAQAGLEDARAKLARHHDFPPKWDQSQEQFSYLEEMVDSGGNSVGHYKVEVGTTFQGSHYWLVQIRSTGYLGNLDDPLARSTLQAELDISPIQRPQSGRVQNPNPRNYQFLYVREGESL